MSRPRPPSPSTNLVKIKHFDRSLPLPAYKSQGAVAVDLSARKKTVIKSHQIAYIPLNVALKLPSGFWGFLVARSSTHKLGILQINAVGVVDADYCGNNDEYLFAAYNFTDKTVVIDKGTRLAQFLVLKFQPLKFIEVRSLSSKSRGGFGTTGKK